MFCTICEYPKSECPHTDEDRKAYEVELCWQANNDLAPNERQALHEQERYDLKRGAYYRTYRERKDEHIRSCR